MIKHNFYKKKTRLAASLLSALLFMSSLVMAQSEKVAYVRVNKYWGSVNALGGNAGTAFSSNDLDLFAGQGALGLRLMGDESHYSGNVTLACTDWKDNSGKIISKALFPHRNELQTNGLDILEPMTNYVRYESPVDSVYYQTKQRQLSSPNFGTLTAQVSPDNCIGTSDQTVAVKNQYVNGVIMTRRVLAWGQQNNDNYVISDLTFDNPADNQTLHNFYIFLQEGNYYFVTADGHTPGIASVDRFYNNGHPRRWYHYYGSRTTDSLRIFYQYASDDPETPGSNMGQPLTEQQGRLFSKDFYFAATLHASKQPYAPAGTVFPAVDANDTDDMNQPMVTTYANIQWGLSLGLFSQSTPVDNPNYYDFIAGKTLESEDMTGANVRPGHHRENLDELGKEAPAGEVGCSPLMNSWESMVYCYGPYEFLPGTQIRIVKASGFAGISRDLAVEVGKKWKNGTLTDPSGLPNPVTGYFPDNFVLPGGSSEMDKIKDRWVSVGIREMHQTVSRAKANFLSGYNAPVTPPPPPKSVVKPSIYGVELSWEPSPAETWPGFAGYRIAKKVSSYDTLYYKLVYQGKNNSYLDGDVRPSPKYFYTIQAGVEADGDTLWSSPFWRYNSEGTSSNSAPSSAGLDKIVMVPNPFNYKDPMLARYNFQTPKNLTLTFFNLPAEVTITVYTEYGDLVTRVKGTGTGDYKMKLVNEKGQAIASGIYVVAFQTPDGSFSYQKLVVSR